MSAEDERFDEPDPLVPRRVGPIVMLVPVLALLLAVLILKDRRPDPGPRPSPPAARAAGDVPGWSGALEVPAGDTAGGARRVTALLKRLHSDPARQAFDARALRERLGLAAGEPWLLTLRYHANRDGSATEPADETPGILVAGVSVAAATGVSADTSDKHGVVLLPLDYRFDPAKEAVADPLRTLLAPTGERLVPGQSVNVFLWGREPRGELELRGLHPLPDGLPAQTTFALQAKSVGRDDDALASLERGAGEGRIGESGR